MFAFFEDVVKKELFVVVFGGIPIAKTVDECLGFKMKALNDGMDAAAVSGNKRLPWDMMAAISLEADGWHISGSRCPPYQLMAAISMEADGRHISRS